MGETDGRGGRSIESDEKMLLDYDTTRSVERMSRPAKRADQAKHVMRNAYCSNFARYHFNCGWHQHFFARRLSTFIQFAHKPIAARALRPNAIYNCIDY